MPNESDLVFIGESKISASQSIKWIIWDPKNIAQKNGESPVLMIEAFKATITRNTAMCESMVPKAKFPDTAGMENEVNTKAN